MFTVLWIYPWVGSLDILRTDTVDGRSPRKMSQYRKVIIEIIIIFGSTLFLTLSPCPLAEGLGVGGTRMLIHLEAL